MSMAVQLAYYSSRCSSVSPNQPRRGQHLPTPCCCGGRGAEGSRKTAFKPQALSFSIAESLSLQNLALYPNQDPVWILSTVTKQKLSSFLHLLKFPFSSLPLTWAVSCSEPVPAHFNPPAGELLGFSILCCL